MSSLKTDFLIHISQFPTCTLILKIESPSQWIKRNNIVNESKKKLTLACLIKRQISLRKKNIPIYISILKIDTTSGSEDNGIIFSTLFPVSALSKKKKKLILARQIKSQISLSISQDRSQWIKMKCNRIIFDSQNRHYHSRSKG